MHPKACITLDSQTFGHNLLETPLCKDIVVGETCWFIIQKPPHAEDEGKERL